MVLNDDYSTDGKSSHHNTGSKGSTGTVRVGSRSLPMYPLIIACLGLLNIILLLTAVALGIYCGQVGEKSPPHQITTDTLLMEVKQLQTMHSEVIEAQKEAQQELTKERRNHQQLKLHLEKNKSLCDGLQGQFERLQVERAALQSNASVISESCGQCMPGWFLLKTSCYFHAKSGYDISKMKNWTDSRADCISRGADLAVIDDWDEEVELYEYLPKVNSNDEILEIGGIWIGLKANKTEGTWVWIDNKPLLGDGYWLLGHASPYGAVIGHCVAFLNVGQKKMWYDGYCKLSREWLCERKANQLWGVWQSDLQT